MTTRRIADTGGVDLSSRQYLRAVAAIVFLAGVFLVLLTLAIDPLLSVGVALVVEAALFFIARKVVCKGVTTTVEIGSVFVLVVFLYGMVPLLSFVVNDFSFPSQGDARLHRMDLTSDEVSGVLWRYVVFLAFFSIAYLFFRGRQGKLSDAQVVPDKRILWTILVALVPIMSFILVLRLTYDMSYETYSDSYLVASRLPLFVAQLMNFLQGVSGVLQVILLAALFSEYRKYRVAIWFWMGMLVVFAITKLESRQHLVVMLAASAIMYHRFVKAASFRLLLAGGLVALGIFHLLGLLRGGLSVSEVLEVNQTFAYGNEFGNLFGNACDVARRRASGRMIPDLFLFYFADLIALVPNQFISSAKFDATTWYVNTFYPEYAAAGGGFAFGAVSEGLLGNDWVDLVWRGAALGGFFSWIHYKHCHAGANLLRVGSYTWITLLSYQSFRATTFRVLPIAVYHLLPTLVLVFCTREILARLFHWDARYALPASQANNSVSGQPQSPEHPNR